MRGFLLVEVVLATALFVLIMTALLGGYAYSEKSAVQAGNITQAMVLAETGMEAVRSIRNEDFDNLIDGAYGVTVASGTWVFSSSSDISTIFTRTITVSPIDKDRKNIRADVSWKDLSNATKTVSLFRTFTNWLDLRYWYYPGLKSTVGLSNGGDKVQVEGNYAYITSSASSMLYVIDVTSSTSPSTVGSVSLTGTLSNLYVSGNYAYVVSQDNTKELQIVDVSVKSNPKVVGFYNAPSSEDGTGVYAVGTTVYMTRQNGGQDEFAIVDASNPKSPTMLGSMNVGATAFEPIVANNLAYIATDNNTEELQIVDVSNPASPVKKGVLNLSLSEQNRSSAITIYGNMLYLGQGKDLYIIDVSSSTNPIQKSDTSVADYFNDIAIQLGRRGKYVFVATSDPNKEFKVYDVSSSTAPVVYGTSLDITGSTPLYGISYSTTTNIVYTVSHDSINSFFVIAP